MQISRTRKQTKMVFFVLFFLINSKIIGKPSTTLFQNNSTSLAGLSNKVRKTSSQTQWTLGCEEMES